MQTLDHIVNIASVTHRSPFRYAGGKTWFIPRIRQWLSSFAIKPTEFVEPFVGGGSISLSVAFEKLAHHVTMVELDNQVAAVWQTIIYGDAEKLANRIMQFDFNTENVKLLLNTDFNDLEEVAFKTTVKNRVTRGGILADGVGLIKTGENGRGLASRWYPETLKRRILAIIPIRQRITFRHDNGLNVMQQYVDNSDTVFFIDPPYTALGKGTGSRLYTHSQLNHSQLFELAHSLKGDFVMTYDNQPGAIELVSRYGFDSEAVAMKNTHHAQMTELVIGRNLDWLRTMKETTLQQHAFAL